MAKDILIPEKYRKFANTKKYNEIQLEYENVTFHIWSNAWCCWALSIVVHEGGPYNILKNPNFRIIRNTGQSMGNMNFLQALHSKHMKKKRYMNELFGEMPLASFL